MTAPVAANDPRGTLEFFKDAGKAIGLAAGLATMWVAPVEMSPVLFDLSLFGAAAVGILLGGGAVVAIASWRPGRSETTAPIQEAKNG